MAGKPSSRKTVEVTPAVVVANHAMENITPV